MRFVFSECDTTSHYIARQWSASRLFQVSSHAGLGFNWKSTYIGGVLLGVVFRFHDLALLRMRVFVCLPREMLTMADVSVRLSSAELSVHFPTVNFFSFVAIAIFVPAYTSGHASSSAFLCVF